jgi:hypothetical protein
MMRRLAILMTGMALLLTTSAPAFSATIFFNGFESDTSGWTGSVTRVASGTNGIPSASGSFHAQISATPFTQWGGYSSTFQEYTTSIDIYLDVDGGWANDTRFDFSSAINNSAGAHRRDFVFNAGFYDDATGPGAGTDRFVISASNNAQPGSAFAKNPARNPIAIDATGWYTFEHHFYDNGGVLAVDMSIFDSTSALVGQWTLSDPTDLINLIGGNRYGWFDYNQFSTLAIDNSELSTLDVVPEPTSLTIFGIGAAVMAIGAVRRRRSLHK